MATAFLLALALIAQDAPVSTAPTATAPPRTQPAATAPTDDYGYVGWCYGALGGYVDLYEKVMLEVTRIEKTFPGPGGFNAAMKEYPAMRDQARMALWPIARPSSRPRRPARVRSRNTARRRSRRAARSGPASIQIDKARLGPGVDELEPARRLRHARQGA